MLSEQQAQLLQQYMQKNRITPQAAQAPEINLPQQSSGGISPSALLQMLGSFFDKPAETLPKGVQGPVRPAQPSMLTQLGNRLDPQYEYRMQLKKILEGRA